MRQVRVIYHWEPEGSWAESPDAPGFSAAGITLLEVQKQVQEGLSFYFDETVQLVESFPDLIQSFSITAETLESHLQTRTVAVSKKDIHPVPSFRISLIPEVVYAGSSPIRQVQA